MERQRSKQTNPTGSRAQQSSETGNQTNDLQELFLDQLADVYDAEQQLIKALPKMAKAAQSDELRQAIEEHLEETREHASRVEEVTKQIGQSTKRRTCKAMRGLIEEGDELIREQKDSSALDAGIIAAAQKVEHYEIATYGTLVTWAEQLGLDEAIDQLQETLDEEKTADQKLTSVATTVANERAQAE